MKSRHPIPLGLRLGLLFCMLLLFPADSASHTASAHPALANPARRPVVVLPVAQSPNPPAPPSAVAAPTTPWDWRAWQLLPPALQAKVDVRILAELRGEVRPAHLGGTLHSELLQPRPAQPLAQTRFLVYLHQQPDLDPLQELVFASQAAQRNAVVQTLLAQTQAAQADLRADLDRRQATTPHTYQPFFLINALAVEGGLDLLVELVQRPDVARLAANYPLHLLQESASTTAAAAQAAAASGAHGPAQPQETRLDDANWNIALVGAERVWDELAIRGEGATVAGFDTGVSFRHPALINRYRGNLGNGRFEHNYNWFEPDGNLYPNGDLGPSVSREPATCGTHGTHTMGTMVGDGGLTGTQVGMAPAARWIALPGICGGTMGGGIRDDIGGIKAFQWLLCPTDLSGALATADCSKAPDVVNNSWGAANPVGDNFRPLIQALRAANIAPVFAAGNPRAADGSIGSPGSVPEALTVGATDRADQVAPFSGRGPSFYPGEQKPELSAPGVDIKSTVGGNGYETSSGTSMAAPHVAGLIALMVAADLRDGTRDFSVDELEQFMQEAAVDRGLPGADNAYGFGRIDAYQAVRAVLTAGDLRGAVRDATTNAPLVGATVVGEGGARFTTATSAQGRYALTVPAGRYQLQVGAWGYLTSTFPSQFVVADALSVADFALQPLARVTVQGRVRSAGVALADVQIHVAAAPALHTQTDATGEYRLSLPVGTHTLLLEKRGYRRTTATVTVAAGAAQLADLTVAPAPTILLVEADAYRGWFAGWPLEEFFRSALVDQGYLHERWPIQYTDQIDTFPLADGSTGYGLPSLATLAAYDLVIWVQSGCNSGLQGCLYANAPTPLGVSPTLQAYMDQGGRLILSGQDLGFWEDGTPLFTDYLHTGLVVDRAAGEGSTLTGHGFLETIALTLTNASLYGYANGSIQLAPDAVLATDAATIAYPILTYDENDLPAALAIDPCDAAYRAVYFAVGYENISPRRNTRDPAWAATLGRSVAWVAGQRLERDFALVLDQPLRFGAPGEQVRYQLQLINTGRQALDLRLTTVGAQWPTALWQGTTPVNGLLRLAPCERVSLTVAVDVPASAATDLRDTLTVTVAVADSAGAAQPPLMRTVQLATGAFANWQVTAPLPTPRYQLSTAALAGTPGVTPSLLYAIGGWTSTATATDPTRPDVASAVNQRFDQCHNQWQTLAPLPEPRAAAALAALDGALYLMGGTMQQPPGLGATVQPHNNLWRYTPATDRWQELAPLPVALSGAAAVGLGGTIYLFGGVDGAGVPTNHTYQYTVATDQWQEGPPLPGPGRAFAAAVRLGDDIAVVGGYPALNLVQLYDPLLAQWRAGSPLQQGRHSFGLTGTPDGAIYAVGGAVGDEGIDTVERLDSAQATWRFMPALGDGNRYGTTAAYLDGQLIAVGGADGQGQTEALRVAHAFCHSAIATPLAVLGVGSTIVYEIKVAGDRLALPAARFRNPLPLATDFVRFLDHGPGAQYNAADHAIEWQGALAAEANPATIRYVVTGDPQQLQSGDRLTNTVIFESGRGLTFTRSATVALLSTDLAGSYKAVDQHQARSGDVLTYTIQVQGGSYLSSTVALRDQLPALLTYVPASLRYENGRGGYDPATRSIWWEGGTTQPDTLFFNGANRYVWGDTDGKGSVGGLTPSWVEIKATGNSLASGDSDYTCGLPIGFGFPFYDQVESTFCVSTNGFLSFDALGNAGDLYTHCPLPNPAGNRGIIAAIWADLVVTDGIYYQTFGSAPHRYLVVQWQGARRFSALGGRLASFQVVLFEEGLIRVAVADAGELRGLNSTTGIADQRQQRGTTYACNQPGSLHDDLSILFVPPGGTIGTAQTQIQFQARVGPETGNPTRDIAAVGINIPVTNTVLITSTVTTLGPLLAGETLQRQVTTLVNPLDLRTSRFMVDRAEVTPQEIVTYQLVLQNTGLVSATAATLAITLPAALRYEEGSVTCDRGRCEEVGGTVQWQGLIAPQQPVVVTLMARLIQGLPDRTPLVATAQLTDGFGNRYPLTTTVLARRSDVSRSQLHFMPPYGEPGTTTLVVALLQNVGKVATTVAAQIALPPDLPVVEGSLRCGTGRCTLVNGVVEWQGPVAPRELIPVQVLLQIPAGAAYGESYGTTLTVDDVDWGETFTLDATFTVMRTFLLPLIFGAEAPYQLYLPLIAAQ